MEQWYALYVFLFSYDFFISGRPRTARQYDKQWRLPILVESFQILLWHKGSN